MSAFRFESSIRVASIVVCFAMGMLLSGCGDDGEGAAATPLEYDVVTSAPRFVVPSDDLPSEVQRFASNNNVEIHFFEGRLFMAWRSAPNHFAGTDTHLYVVSSADGGAHWEFEHEVFLGTDMREPRLLDLNGELEFLFFQGGSNPTAFEPQRIYRTRRLGLRQWSALELITEEDEVPWDIKVRNGVAYLTSYQGGHYDPRDMGSIEVYLKESRDGLNFTKVANKPYVYRGGVSETAFDFDAEGTMWIVTRNEDGDSTGFGSHLCTAPASALAQWNCPAQSSPDRYDSPEMFRHGDELYLVARRDIGGPYDEGLDDLDFEQKKIRYLLDYSRRAKTSALYRIDRANHRVEHVIDLPGAGDNAFPSIQQTGPNSYLLANYTSPIDHPEITWLEGQTSDRGTAIYLLDINFVPRGAGTPALPTRTSTPTFVPSPTATSVVDPNLQVYVQPVFAPLDEALSIHWSSGAPTSAVLDLGDGNTAGTTTTSHTYAAAGIYDLRDLSSNRHGAVARTSALAVTPTGTFILAFPSNPLAQSILPGVIPGFYWAAAGGRLAIGVDPTNTAAFDFRTVVVTPLIADANGDFATQSTDLTIELTSLEGGLSGQYVHLRDVRLTGILMGDGFGASPLVMNASIVVEDVVAILVDIGGFDHTAALEFVAGLFGFDPSTPPETAHFQGEFPLRPLL